MSDKAIDFYMDNDRLDLVFKTNNIVTGRASLPVGALQAILNLRQEEVDKKYRYTSNTVFWFEGRSAHASKNDPQVSEFKTYESRHRFGKGY